VLRLLYATGQNISVIPGFAFLTAGLIRGVQIHPVSQVALVAPAVRVPLSLQEVPEGQALPGVLAVLEWPVAYSPPAKGMRGE